MQARWGMGQLQDLLEMMQMLTGTPPIHPHPSTLITLDPALVLSLSRSLPHTHTLSLSLSPSLPLSLSLFLARSLSLTPPLR